MICLSSECPRYNNCARAFSNAKMSGTFEYLASFGTCSYGKEPEYLCGPRGNFKMFIEFDEDYDKKVLMEPITTCKCCKYWQEDLDEDCDILHACRRLHLRDTRPDDYCSFGERKKL